MLREIRGVEKWKGERKGVDFANSERRVLSAISNFDFGSSAFDGLTQGQIAFIAKMPKRTVRAAVLRLKEKGYIKEMLEDDARMSAYAIGKRRRFA